MNNNQANNNNQNPNNNNNNQNINQFTNARPNENFTQFLNFEVSAANIVNNSDLVDHVNSLPQNENNPINTDLPEEAQGLQTEAQVSTVINNFKSKQQLYDHVSGTCNRFTASFNTCCYTNLVDVSVGLTLSFSNQDKNVNNVDFGKYGAITVPELESFGQNHNTAVKFLYITQKKDQLTGRKQKTFHTVNKDFQIITYITVCEHDFEVWLKERIRLHNLTNNNTTGTLRMCEWFTRAIPQSEKMGVINGSAKGRLGKMAATYLSTRFLIENDSTFSNTQENGHSITVQNQFKDVYGRNIVNSDIGSSTNEAQVRDQLNANTGFLQESLTKTQMKSRLFSEMMESTEMKDAMTKLGEALIRIGVIELGQTNLKNKTIAQIEIISEQITQSIAEIERDHANDQAEVCVAMQFLKDTIVDLLTRNEN